MAKQLNVSLAFNADTRQAKAQIQDLQNQINNLVQSTANTKLPLTQDINSAITAAGKLQSMLKMATNVNTGKLDLSKFSTELKKGGISLNEYADHFKNLGPEGERAFTNLAKAVITAEVPLKRSSALMTELWTTLKNTARWQISSNILHGFQGSLESAYRYAQDLDKSLNNIRIVTSKSAEEMAIFAKEANSAAKTLSTTTTRYTDASLIYYQQGLAEEEVKKRADITLKMANVTGENAEDVSSYMTAIWNNFDDGSKSLEYYADVITRLGADTAASSEEIANGLEKFAAIGETVGLSYEYATASLATIVDKTRQSEEVVGTALKTIFARIQGLSLGETLDDGVTLNKYSEALQKVGISIFDENNQLKEMDTILDEMGEKWKTLNTAQQVALAETVAGVRQYNQLVSLMDNWEDVEKNISAAAGATGSLAEQQKIYEESWEGSRNRVKAAMEGLFDSLIDEEFFIDINDGVETVITSVTSLVDAIGGIEGVLLTVGAVATSVFKKQIGSSINTALYNFSVFTGAAEDTANLRRKEMVGAIDSFNQGADPNSSEYLEGEVLKRTINRTYELQQQQELLNNEQREYYQELINIEAQYGEIAVAAKKAHDEAVKSSNDLMEDFLRLQGDKVIESGAEGFQLTAQDTYITHNPKELKDSIRRDLLDVKSLIDNNDLTAAFGNLGNIQYSSNKEIFDKFQSYYDEDNPLLQILPQQIQAAYTEALDPNSIDVTAVDRFSNYIRSLMTDASTLTEDGIIDNLTQSFLNLNSHLNETPERVRPIIQAFFDQKKSAGEADEATKNYQERVAKTEKDLTKASSAISSYGMAIASTMQGVFQITSAINIFRSSLEQLENDDLSFWDRFTIIITALGTSLPMLIGGLSSLANALKTFQSLQGVSLKLIGATILGLSGETVERAKNAEVTLLQAYAQKKLGVEIGKNDIQGKGLLGMMARGTLGLGKILLILGLVTAAIAAVTIVLKKVYDAKHKARYELEKSQKSLEQTSEKYDEVASSIQNVNAALDSLENRKDALDELTYGSAEWRQELYGINEEFDKILSQYDDLVYGKDWYIDSSGMKQFTEEGKQNIDNENEKREYEARSAKDVASFINNKNTFAAGKEAIVNDNKYSHTIWTKQEDYSGSVKETDINYTSEKHNLSEEALDLILSKLYDNPEIDLSNSENLSNIDGLSKKDIELITSNEELQNSLKELTISTDAMKESYENSLANTLTSDKEIWNNVYGEKSNIDEEYRADTINQIAQDIQSEVNKAIETGILSTGENASDYIDEYATSQGLEQKNGKYYKTETDENGNVTITDEEVENIEDLTAAWKEQYIQIEKNRKSIKKYEEAVEKSKKVWATAKTLRDIEGQEGAWTKVRKAVDDVAISGEELISVVDQDAFATLRSGLADMMEIEDDLIDDFLSPDFIVDNANLIEQAINGSGDALDLLKVKAAEQILIDAEVINTPEQLTTDFNNILNQVNAEIEDIEVNSELKLEDFNEGLKTMLESGAITAEQLTNYLRLQGFEGITIEEETKETPIPLLKRVWMAISEGVPLSSIPKTDVDTVGYRIKEGSSTSRTSSPGNNFGSTLNNLSGSGKGKNSTISEFITPDLGNNGPGLTDKDTGSKKTNSRFDAEKETVERFKEINDLLDDQADKLDKINDKANLEWGKDRIKALKKINKELEAENKLLDEKINQANTYMKKDQNTIEDNLNALAFQWGIDPKKIAFNYDDEGNITNYTEIIEDLQTRLFNEKEAYDDLYGEKEETTASKAMFESIETAEELLNNVIDAASNYDEAREEKEDAQKDKDDNNLEKLSNNFEALETEIELRVTINENDKKALDFAFSSISEDVYKASEALALIWSDTDFDLIDQATQALDNNSFAITRLKEDYEAGKISKTDYLERMQEEYDSIFDNVEALQELDEQMKEYYGNTLDMAIEEISKYTDHMDSLTSVLDHYKSILELTGRGQNYDAMDKILQGQAKTLKNNYDVAKKNYEMLLKEKETVEARIKTMDVTSAGYEMEKEKLDKLIAETDAAYDEMLSDAESYLSVLQEIWTAALENIKEETEKALTGNMGFDSLMDSLNNLKDYQDEYLTKVNQEFEMQKLMSNVQRDIDKTNNVAAKQRLNNFAKEIEQLEEKDKLSNLELEIAQAKYKQLQAQIALEEAQNAKSVVRLSRDNEGNYGYVYTSDQNAINEAEDRLNQANNDLYNIRLNATNEYGEKMLQAEQEYLDKVAEIWEKYGDDDETRNKELARVKKEFYQLIDTYSELYTIAQQEDTNVVRDAWINQYDDILGASLNWKTKLEEYVQAIEDKHEEWQAVAGPILDDLNLKTNNLATAVNSVTIKSNEMKDALIKEGGVIDTLGTELDAVNDVTAAYEKQRDMIQEVIDKMLEKAKLIQAELKEESGVTGWNTHVGDRITTLKEEGKSVAQWESHTGQIHYMTYDPNKMTEKEAKAALKKKYDTETFDNAAEWNEKIATKLNGLEEPRYHGYDINGKYHYHKTKEGLEKILKKYGGQMPGSQITYYDTGGYTGEWGPEGKLAMLHEKEIVLNKEDSANILKVVEIVRTMIDTNVAQAGLGMLQASTVADNRQTLEQTVTITAEFPNATDHNEIELAFDSLINRATQYANRK